MKTQSLLALLWVMLAFSPAYASIYCPADITLYCDDDIHYLPVTGKATAPLYPPSWIKYKDNSSLNQCNVGTVQRTWYVDMNQNNNYESTEPHCSQLLSLLAIEGSVVINFPQNKTYGCKEDIIRDKPTWTSGPCDVIGYHAEEWVYEVSDDACYKIFRKFTVINWCTYNPAIQGSGGIWEHTQIIKVIEKDPPVIADCTSKILPLEGDCKATFTISNSATDQGNCPTKLVSWVVDIDLWANGTNDYKYGYNEPGDYKLEPVQGGTAISITLPERVAEGKHKIHWSVRDECGNYSSCTTYIETKDQKKPIPYLHQILVSAFDASQMPAMITPRLFDVGSFDNCTPKQWLKFSFSPDVNDTLRIVDCTNAGFQFYTVYITDHAGNQEAVDVYMLVFDNGSCFATGNLAGRIAEPNGRPVTDAAISLERLGSSAAMAYPGTDGTFSWDGVSLYSDYIITPEVQADNQDRIDIADYRLLLDHIMGINKLVNFQYAAADLNGDNKIRLADLALMKNLILAPEKSDITKWRVAIEADTLRSEADLASLKERLDIMKFDGRVDIKAICKGDISAANEQETQNRGYHQLEYAIHGDRIDFYIAEKESLEGFQLEINLGDCEADIVSEHFGLKDLYSGKEPGTYRVLMPKTFDTGKGNPLFSVTGCPDADVELGRFSKVLTKSGSTSELRLKHHNPPATGITFYPNPGQGNFMISHPAIKVIDVTDMAGKNVTFTRTSDGLTLEGKPGLYIVRTEQEGKIMSHKLMVR